MMKLKKKHVDAYDNDLKQRTEEMCSKVAATVESGEPAGSEAVAYAKGFAAGLLAARGILRRHMGRICEDASKARSDEAKQWSTCADETRVTLEKVTQGILARARGTEHVVDSERIARMARALEVIKR